MWSSGILDWTHAALSSSGIWLHLLPLALSFSTRARVGSCCPFGEAHALPGRPFPGPVPSWAQAQALGGGGVGAKARGQGHRDLMIGPLMFASRISTDSLSSKFPGDAKFSPPRAPREIQKRNKLWGPGPGPMGPWAHRRSGALGWKTGAHGPFIWGCCGRCLFLCFQCGCAVLCFRRSRADLNTSLSTRSSLQDTSDGHAFCCDTNFGGHTKG